MSLYLMYINDHGASVRCIDGEERSPEEIYKSLVDEHGDDYYETHAYILDTERQAEGDIQAWEVFIPEYEDDSPPLTNGEFSYSRCCDPSQLMTE